MPDIKLIHLEKNNYRVPTLKHHKFIGIDTEFMREKTFFAQLCLIQIATKKKIFIIDPIDARNLDKLWKTLSHSTWILHAARQDIEVVYQSSRKMPNKIFDTQIAAGILGFTPQIGYSTLVEELFGVMLQKSQTRANWTKRPMSRSMINYAAEDVEYLMPIYEVLRKKLEDSNRLDWAWEDSAGLLESSLYEPNPNAAIEKIKAAKYLTGKTRSAAVALATWREQYSREKNRPKQWILKDSVLMEIAASNPAHPIDLSKIPGAPSSFSKHLSGDILEIIKKSQHKKNNYTPPARHTEEQKMILKEMSKRVEQKALNLKIYPEILCSKKELLAIGLGENNSRVFNGWRKKIIGEELLKLL